MAKKRTRSKGRGRQSKVTQASRRRNAATKRRRAANARARSMRRRQNLRSMLASAAAIEAIRRRDAAELRRLQEEQDLMDELNYYGFDWQKRDKMRV